MNINSAVWWPATAGLLMKLAAGMLGAWAYTLVIEGVPRSDPDASDILQLLMLHDQPAITQWSAYLWDVTTLIPGIPVLAIMIRYNLLSGGVCGPFWSFFWGVVFPWLTAFPLLYMPDILGQFVNFTSLTFVYSLILHFLQKKLFTLTFINLHTNDKIMS